MTDTKYKATKAWVGAVIATVVAFLGAVLAGLQEVGPDSGLGDLSDATWISAVIAALMAFGGTGVAVYRVENKPKTVPPRHVHGNPNP